MVLGKNYYFFFCEDDFCQVTTSYSPRHPPYFQQTGTPVMYLFVFSFSSGLGIQMFKLKAQACAHFKLAFAFAQ